LTVCQLQQISLNFTNDLLSKHFLQTNFPSIMNCTMRIILFECHHFTALIAQHRPESSYVIVIAASASKTKCWFDKSYAAACNATYILRKLSLRRQFILKVAYNNFTKSKTCKSTLQEFLFQNLRCVKLGPTPLLK